MPSNWTPRPDCWACPPTSAGKESAASAVQTTRFYAVYPYDASNQLVSDGVLSVTLPAKQKYAEGSFGLGTGWMTAVTADLQDHHLTFKNVMGFLKLRIYGGAKIDQIVFRGNREEVVSGTATISVAYGGAPAIAMTGTGTTVKLNCSNVETGAKEADATAFWRLQQRNRYPYRVFRLRQRLQRL